MAVHFRLLATSDSAPVAWLPVVFPAIVAVALGLSGMFRLMRPKRLVVEAAPPVAAAAVPLEGDPASAGPWTVRYGFAVVSEPKPTLAAAQAHALYLRDQHGAAVRAIAPAG